MVASRKNSYSDSLLKQKFLEAKSFAIFSFEKREFATEHLAFFLFKVIYIRQNFSHKKENKRNKKKRKEKVLKFEHTSHLAFGIHIIFAFSTLTLKHYQN
jgi:hypothetical protein